MNHKLAGLVDSLWSMEDLLDTVQEAAQERKSDERHAKLTARLRSE